MEQECLVEKCAKEIRKQKGLPDNSIVPVSIYCDCPKCRPKYV